MRSMHTVFFAGLFLASAGCTGRSAEEGPPERLVMKTEQIAPADSGAPDRGYGASVAYVGDALYVGEPWQGGGRVHGPSGVVLTSADGSRLGEAIAGGEALLAGAPGLGQLLDGDGRILIDAGAGDRVGGAPIWHDGSWLVLARDGVRSEAASWTLESSPWSLISARLGTGRRPVWIAGLRGGGLAWDGGSAPGDGALGRGLLACDVDADGDDDLVLSDPATGLVRVYVVDGLEGLDLERPSMEHRLGVGAGRTLACLAGGLVVGAPDLPNGGGIAWMPRPMDPNAALTAQWLRSTGVSSLGHSMAVGPGRTVAVGDPGRGMVRVYGPE